MNKIKKIFICVISVVIVLSAIPVNADESVMNKGRLERNDICKVSKERGFAANKEHSYFIGKKIEKEKKSKTGIVNDKIEKKLNENGIFDEEINKSSTNELDTLNGAEMDTIQIYTQYYAVDDSEELKDKKVEESEMIELTEEETEDYIGYKYYGKKTDLFARLCKKMTKYKKHNISKEQNWLYRIGTGLGVIPISVSASMQSKGGKDDKSNPTMLKKIMIVSQQSGTKKLSVVARYIWTEMPKYRELDSISLSWDNAKYVSGDVQVYHKWVYEHYDYYPFKKQKKTNYIKKEEFAKMKYNANPALLKNNQYHVRNGYICAAADLHNDISKTINTRWYVKTNYYNEEVCFIIQLKRSAKKVIFYPYYEHTKTTVDLVQVALDVMDGGRLSTAYSLTSGKSYKVDKEYSGVNSRFIFDF